MMLSRTGISATKPMVHMPNLMELRSDAHQQCKVKQETTCRISFIFSFKYVNGAHVCGYHLGLKTIENGACATV